jgi:SAM-dependent methyltransferase
VEDIERFLSGDALYGDDFSAEAVAQWQADEAEAYADLGAKDATTYEYRYHALNVHHAYRHLPGGRFAHVLGLGSAYGDEFLPIVSRMDAVTIVDPSDAFVRERVHGVAARYLKPDPSGRLGMATGTFDLVTCLGVLHHIPNVSFVMSELARVLKPGGYLALQEPIVSMGDWRKPRRGLTKHERGIPLAILREIAMISGFDIKREGVCMFPLSHRVFNLFARGTGVGGTYNNRFAVALDSAVCAAFRWNVHYHPRTLLQRFCPGSAFFLLQKPGI